MAQDVNLHIKDMLIRSFANTEFSSLGMGSLSPAIGKKKKKLTIV